MRRKSGNTNYTHRSSSLVEAGSSTVVNAFIEAESIAVRIFDLFDKSAGSVIDAFSTAFGFVQQMVSLVQSIQNASSILDSIFSFLPGGGVIGEIFGGGRAEGGSVSNRVPYIVGEQGPEVFIPDVNGLIIPGSSASAYLSSVQPTDSLNSSIASAGVSSSRSPNITVIVQSEVESSKAIRFFNNHFPDYESRKGKENF